MTVNTIVKIGQAVWDEKINARPVAPAIAGGRMRVPHTYYIATNQYYLIYFLTLLLLTGRNWRKLNPQGDELQTPGDVLDTVG